MTETDKQDPKLTVIDGRRQRSARSRKALIKASLELIDQGILVPTAKQIADKAKVGVRSFFRHFDDMEALFAAVDAHAHDDFISLFPYGDGQGDLPARIQAFLDNQAAAYERLRNIILSTHAQLWRSPTLRQRYARDQEKLRDVIVSWFPELEGQSQEVIEGFSALASFDMWHRLRHFQELGVRESKTILAALIMAFLAQNRMVD